MGPKLPTHFFLLAFSFAPNLLTLFSSPLQVFPHCLPLALLLPCCMTQLVFQVATRSNHLALSFLSIVTDNLRPFFSQPLPSPVSPPSLSYHQQRSQFQRRVNVCNLTQRHLAIQYAEAKNSIFDPGRMAAMVWSGSATHPSNCTRLWCSK